MEFTLKARALGTAASTSRPGRSFPTLGTVSDLGRARLLYLSSTVTPPACLRALDDPSRASRVVAVKSTPAEHVARHRWWLVKCTILTTLLLSIGTVR